MTKTRTHPVATSAREVAARRNPPIPAVTALESDLPVEHATMLPTVESWRKEIHRPVTYLHKWWAHRLGTVFRGVLAAAVTETADQARNAYLDPLALSGVRVYDPCAGSGTTGVEVAKLGGTAHARDINPVATLVARQAVTAWNRHRLTDLFSYVADQVADPIRALHTDRHGRDVLHYFWVATLPCPQCATETDLHACRVFAKHAYPVRHPTGHVTCPHCDGVTALDVTRRRERFVCSSCRRRPTVAGAFSGRSITCEVCEHRSRLTNWTEAHDEPPHYRMYAKLLADGDQRVYEPVDDHDLALYEHASGLLAAAGDEVVRPAGTIADGHNTIQLLRWNITRWEQLYSDRQAYCLGLVAAAVRDLDPSPEREALAALVSGATDFHTRLTSYKGEGTGAIRHTFTNHVLQPQRTPIESHVWGVGRSSGGIAGLFASRLLRSHEYKHDPTDLVFDGEQARRVTGVSSPLTASAVEVTCGDGADSGLADGSVDLVVTDPPYIGKVFYSELADFFHAWLSGIRPYATYPTVDSTRSDAEAQDPDPHRFAATAQRIWGECHRVLADHGLVAFTFHHPQAAGWAALIGSLNDAGFAITGLQPVKGEMSSSVVKRQAADPTDLDVVVVARKAGHAAAPWPADHDQSVSRMRAQLAALADNGLALRRGDVAACAYAAAVAAALARGDDADTTATCCEQAATVLTGADLVR